MIIYNILLIFRVKRGNVSNMFKILSVKFNHGTKIHFLDKGLGLSFRNIEESLLALAERKL